jgi:nucleoid-associated protein YgaU
MANPMEALVKSASGTGAPTNPGSRYYGFSVDTLTRADGEKVAYLQRRIIPQREIYGNVTNYTVVEGDRLDNLAAKFLGDPLLYWMICDANGAVDPDELTSRSQVGRQIKTPLVANVPPGARNG